MWNNALRFTLVQLASTCIAATVSTKTTPLSQCQDQVYTSTDQERKGKKRLENSVPDLSLMNL